MATSHASCGFGREFEANSLARATTRCEPAARAQAAGAGGRPAAWHHRIYSTSIATFWDPPEQARPEAQEISGAVNVPYAIPRVLVEYSPLASSVPRAWWRGVEEVANAFPVECFIDELAVAARIDPLRLRMQLLAGSRRIANPANPEGPPCDAARLRNVLQLAASRAGWGKPLPAGRGRGIACHYAFSTYVAQVVEVSVSRSGDIRVHRVTCALDCGRAVHPDGVRAQMEGSIVFGLTAALYGEITVANGAVEQSNFNDYPMLRMGEAPAIDVHIVASAQDPTGVGEPGTAPIAPALCNALFAASGQRVRRLPVHRL